MMICSLFGLTWFDIIWQCNSVGIITVGIHIRYLSTSYTLRIHPPQKMWVPTNRVYSVHPLTSCEMPWKANLHRELNEHMTPQSFPKTHLPYHSRKNLLKYMGKWYMGPAYGVQRSERNPQLRLHLRCCIGNSPFAACSAVRRKKGDRPKEGLRVFSSRKNAWREPKDIKLQVEGHVPKDVHLFFRSLLRRNDQGWLIRGYSIVWWQGIFIDDIQIWVFP